MAYIIQRNGLEVRSTTRQNSFSQFPCGFDIIHQGITTQIDRDTYQYDEATFESLEDAKADLALRLSSVEFSADGKIARVTEYVLVDSDEYEIIDISEMRLYAWVQLENDELLEKTFDNYPEAKAWVDSFDVVVRWGIR